MCAIVASVFAALVPRPVDVQASAAPALDHVFVVGMENHSYNEIIGSTSTPYITSLLPGEAVATNYTAVAHPSLPNHLALAGGSTFGITSDCTTCWVSGGEASTSSAAPRR